jgi:hypothetical protein
MMEPFGGFSLFGIMGFMFPLFFILVFGIIIFSFIRGISQWNRNNHQPVLTVEAKITSKRGHTSHHHRNINSNLHHSSSTTYYVTFEVESGDRMELHVPDQEYGLLAEGDFGRLTFQGTRYLGFERYMPDSGPETV